MGFRSNKEVVTGSMAMAVEADRVSNVYLATGATVFVIQPGEVGDDTFLGFGSDDTILTSKPILDFNGDGFISPGPNGIIDLDRTGPDYSGPDHVQLISDDDRVVELRALGSKAGQFAYADGATRKNLWGEFGQENVVEGTIANDRINVGNGAKVILHDNALGLNLGGDTISGFGSDDLLVTTSKLFDGNNDGTIGFGRNRVLDMSGSGGANDADPRMGAGGQLKFVDTNIRSLEYLGSHETNGVTYYYYGTSGSTYVVGTDPA